MLEEQFFMLGDLFLDRRNILFRHKDIFLIDRRNILFRHKDILFLAEGGRFCFWMREKDFGGGIEK